MLCVYGLLVDFVLKLHVHFQTVAKDRVGWQRVLWEHLGVHRHTESCHAAGRPLADGWPNGHLLMDESGRLPCSSDDRDFEWLDVGPSCLLNPS